MADIVFTQRPTSVTSLGLNSEATRQFCRANHLLPSDTLGLCKAYRDAPSTKTDGSITNYLNSLPTWQRYCVVDMATVASHESIALAKFSNRYFSEENINRLNSFVGAAATAAGARLDTFERQIVAYQVSLKELWQLSRNHPTGRGTAAAKQKARRRVRQAYAALEQAYAIELKNTRH